MAALGWHAGCSGFRSSRAQVWSPGSRPAWRRSHLRVSALQLTTAAGTTPHSVHSILQQAERTRRVHIPAPTEAIGKPDTLFEFQSIEVFAVLMSATSRLITQAYPHQPSFKKERARLAQALLTSDNTHILNGIAQRTAKAIQAYAGRAPWRAGISTQSASPVPTVTDAQIQQQTLMSITRWVEAVKAHRDWPLIQPLLQTVMTAQPEVIPSTDRDGAAGESSASQALSAALPPGWVLHSGLVVQGVQGLDMEAQGAPGTKGVKGELDLVLVNPEGEAVGVGEVKLGGGAPYRQLYNDSKKLTRLMGCISGKKVTFVNPVDASVIPVRVCPKATPFYMILRDKDTEEMDGQQAVLQAENMLLKINVSMALGQSRAWLPSRSQPGVLIQGIDSQYAKLDVPAHLVQTMRRKVSVDFRTTLSSVDVYEMAPPEGQDWGF